MSPERSTPTTPAGGTLRLLMPQWQGAGLDVVTHLMPGYTRDEAQLGYHLGSHLLSVIAPHAAGPVVEVPVDLSTDGLVNEQGIYARTAILNQLRSAVQIVKDSDPDRVVVFGGECSVSVGPFSHLASRYPDLAVLWIDAHPDTGTPGDHYTGYHAMAVAVLTGEGDTEIVAALPATIPANRILNVGLRSWDDEGIATKERLGIASPTPAQIADNSDAVLNWLNGTGATHVAVHLDLDVLDPADFRSVLGSEPDGVRLTHLVRLLTDVSAAYDVVGMSVAEHVPRELMVLRRLLSQLPLIGQ